MKRLQMLQLNIGIQMTKATLVAALQQDLVARIVGVGSEKKAKNNQFSLIRPLYHCLTYVG